MKRVFLILFVVISFHAYSQKSKQDLPLGFFCGYSGSETKVVENAANLLYEKKYDSIVELLYSESPAENYLGIVLCKKLELEKLIILKKVDLDRISILSKSSNIVPTCGGCTERKKIKLSRLLKSKEYNFETEDYFFGKH